VRRQIAARARKAVEEQHDDRIPIEVEARSLGHVRQDAVDFRRIIVLLHGCERRQPDRAVVRIHPAQRRRRLADVAPGRARAQLQPQPADARALRIELAGARSEIHGRLAHRGRRSHPRARCDEAQRGGCRERARIAPSGEGLRRVGPPDGIPARTRRGRARGRTGAERRRRVHPHERQGLQEASLDHGRASGLGPTGSGRGCSR
jgi:hypothetical protein